MLNAFAITAAAAFIALAAVVAFDADVRRAPVQRLRMLPAGLSAAFAVFSVIAVTREGPLGFWVEHSRNLWGNQLWFDLLLAAGTKGTGRRTGHGTRRPHPRPPNFQTCGQRGPRGVRPTALNEVQLTVDAAGAPAPAAAFGGRIPQIEWLLSRLSFDYSGSFTPIPTEAPAGGSTAES
jgi:hypothetical protein